MNGFGVQNGYKHSRSPTVSHETMKVMGKPFPWQLWRSRQISNAENSNKLHDRWTRKADNAISGV